MRGWEEEARAKKKNNKVQTFLKKGWEHRGDSYQPGKEINGNCRGVLLIC